VYEEGTVARLKEGFEAAIPVIAFVQSSELSYWQGESFQHAVVIVGLEDHSIWLLDPDMDEKIIEVSVDEFLLAWLGMDYLYAAIYREM
jgi:ABC-type bacteriocin/lantibiotic exporter with double-glycine peptidase domain